ncbi:glycosyltransferase involved in cell wall biogenesis [Clostridium sp. SY8519]|uniref:glycosyltransferase family 2 protein n=1 Tax=Clostridium sp. (strain SY8519) TaxID=1042156 RepID=UPI0002171D80|nr:glycosyltransferase family 2 protein [Clostridium sp. SY8519]BAK47163.1 glycosyltransferase involved in cell wall biogenesis [Clostridium sp. SY8519]
MTKLLSAIIPCFNEQDNVEYFYEEFMKNRSFFEKNELEYELIYVDDGSKDETIRKIKEINEKDSRVGLISFSRNFGKEAAMYAGLQEANGDYVAIMDADLQDPPSLLPKMFSYIMEGYDQVATRRTTREGEPPIRSWFAKRFYHLINRFSKTEIVDGSRDFRLMTRQVVDSILEVTEYNRFSKGLFSWVGYKTKWIDFENVERKYGQTKWSFWSLFRYALDGIVAYSTVPLALASFFGIIFCIIALLMIIFIIIRKIIFGDPTPGWPSMVCIILIIGGIQLLCVGIIGQYLAKTYLEVKNRPIFLVSEKVKPEKKWVETKKDVKKADRKI